MPYLITLTKSMQNSEYHTKKNISSIICIEHIFIYANKLYVGNSQTFQGGEIFSLRFGPTSCFQYPPRNVSVKKYFSLQEMWKTKDLFNWHRLECIQNIKFVFRDCAL